MTRIYIDTEITETGTFRNSAAVLTDPDTVTFTYRHDQERDWSTATATKSSTGIYTAAITPKYPGYLHFQWKGVGTLDVTTEGTRKVERSAFARNRTTDYC